MQKAMDFIKANKVFYLATLDGGQARVRPFGIMINLNGKLSFCTSNEKDVYKQMAANKKVEICSTAPEGDYLRLTGTVVFDESQVAKEKIFEAMPHLRDLYKGKEDSLIICTFDHVTATYQKMGSPKETGVLY
jgi:uncharacterized pyridoxamine 5'-phosphate oxidase family protein